MVRESVSYKLLRILNISDVKITLKRKSLPCLICTSSINVFKQAALNSLLLKDYLANTYKSTANGILLKVILLKTMCLPQ